MTVGIIGAGLMGRWHTYVARRLGAEIVTVVDKNLQAAQCLARQTNRAAVYPDLDTMLQSARPDVVHLCTPLPTHVPLALRAIESGIHVLAEKPLASSTEEVSRLHTAANIADVLICPVHQFVFQNGVREAATVLPSLGEVLRVDFNICSAGGVGRPETELDGIVSDILPHPLSLLRSLWPHKNLDTRTWSTLRTRSGELLILGDFDGIAASLYISMHARPTCCTFSLQCSQGSVHINLFHGYVVIESSAVSRLVKISQPFVLSSKTLYAAAANLVRRAWNRELAYPGLYVLTARFYDAVKGISSVPISAEDSIAVAVAREQMVQRALPWVYHQYHER